MPVQRISNMVMIAMLLMLLQSSCTAQRTITPALPNATTTSATTITRTLTATATKAIAPTATPTRFPPTGGIQPTHILPTTTPTPAPTLALLPTISIPQSPLALNEANAGTQMKRLARWGRGTLNDFAWSPDGKTLAVATGVGVYLINTASFQAEKLVDINDEVTRVAFRPDSQVIAVALSTRVSVWSLKNGQKLAEMDGEIAGGIWALAYGKGGHIAAYGQQTPGTGEAVQQVKLWQDTTGRLIYQDGDIFMSSHALDISPDGKLLLYWKSTSGLAMLDIASGKLRAGLGDGAFDAVFSPDGTKIYYSHLEAEAPWIQIWNLSTESGEALPQDFPSIGLARNGNAIVHFGQSTGLLMPTTQGDFETSYQVDRATVSPDGKYLAYAGSGSTDIQVREVVSGKDIQILHFPGFTSQAVGMAQVDGEMHYLAAIAVPGEIRLWDLVSGSAVRTLPIEGGEVRGLAFSPDRRTLASVDTNHTVRLWEIENGAELARYPAEDEVDGPLMYSPDGERLAMLTLAQDAIIELDLQSGLYDQPGGNSNAFSYAYTLTYPPFAYNREGHLLGWGIDSDRKQLILTDLITQQTTDFPLPSKIDFSAVESLTLSADGSYLAAGMDSGEIFVWDQKSQKLLRIIQGHQTLYGEGWMGAIRHLEFSPATDLLVSVGYDNTTRLWNIQAGTQLRKLEVCCYIGFPPGGRFLVTAGSGVIRLWGVAQK